MAQIPLTISSFLEVPIRNLALLYSLCSSWRLGSWLLTIPWPLPDILAITTCWRTSQQFRKSKSDDLINCNISPFSPLWFFPHLSPYDQWARCMHHYPEISPLKNVPQMLQLRNGTLIIHSCSQYWPSIQFNPSSEWIVCLPTSLMSFFHFPAKNNAPIYASAPPPRTPMPPSRLLLLNPLTPDARLVIANAINFSRLNDETPQERMALNNGGAKAS